MVRSSVTRLESVPGRIGCSSRTNPSPKRAPVVVFFHGWFAVNPGFYGAWIDHLVRNGRIVIFPAVSKGRRHVAGGFSSQQLGGRPRRPRGTS